MPDNKINCGPLYSGVYRDEYGRDDVLKMDVLRIKKAQFIRLAFLSSRSDCIQGVRFGVDRGEGGIWVGEQHDLEMIVWEDSSYDNVDITAFSSEGLLSVYNVEWDPESIGRKYWARGDYMGMLLEELGNKRIYRCNHSNRDGNFDNLVFSIELLDFDEGTFLRRAKEKCDVIASSEHRYPGHKN